MWISYQCLKWLNKQLQALALKEFLEWWETLQASTHKSWTTWTSTLDLTKCPNCSETIQVSLDQWLKFNNFASDVSSNNRCSSKPLWLSSWPNLQRSPLTSKSEVVKVQSNQ